MSKIEWKGSTLLAPVPAALVSCGTVEHPNALTIAWTGITCSDPPMTYVSIRPERYSYGIIRETGEFVINLTTGAMARATDFCGVRSGRDMDKAKEVIAHDDIVDELFGRVKKELINMIHENAEVGEQASDLLMAAKYFERIGDHATNISEWVIFSITGEHPDDK